MTGGTGCVNELVDGCCLSISCLSACVPCLSCLVSRLRPVPVCSFGRLFVCIVSLVSSAFLSVWMFFLCLPSCRTSVRYLTLCVLTALYVVSLVSFAIPFGCLSGSVCRRRWRRRMRD